MKKILLAAVIFLFCSGSNLFAQKTKKPERFFDPKEMSEVGVYYYPEHWDESQWKRDFIKMKQMGFNFVHFAEFAWAQLEPSEGVYDFAWLDRAVALAEGQELKVIMCTSTATPPVWLLRKHPDIAIQQENGIRLDHGARQHPSPSSTFYREYSLKMIEKLAQHYGNDKRIMGWQLDNEPHVAFDYGEVAQQRFRGWLKDRYQTIDALNKAWGTAFWSQVYSDFSQINIPQLSVMFMNSHQILDYKRFATDEVASSLMNKPAQFVRILFRSSGSPVIIFRLMKTDMCARAMNWIFILIPDIWCMVKTMVSDVKAIVLVRWNVLRWQTISSVPLTGCTV